MGLLPVLAVLGCAPAPMTEARAVALCRDEARLADGVAGTVGLGVSNTGVAGQGSITVTNRVFNPQTEEDFVAECVARRMAGRAQPDTTTVGITIGGSL